MTDGLASIIAQLEQQKAAIERALAALRDIGTTAPAASAPPARKAGKTSSARNLRSEGQKRRWAAKKAAATESRQDRLSDEGRQKLADAMKKRWAVKRAASAVKKRATKKA